MWAWLSENVPVVPIIPSHQRIVRLSRRRRAVTRPPAVNAISSRMSDVRMTDDGSSPDSRQTQSESAVPVLVANGPHRVPHRGTRES